MIAYDRKNIESLEIRQLAGNWLASGLIDESTKLGILNSRSGYYTSTKPLVQVGLFLFTLLATLASAGLLGVFLNMGRGEDGIGYTLVFLFFLAAFFLEYLIRKKHIYKSGVDTAMLYFSFSSLIIGLNILINHSSDNSAVVFFTAFILLTLGSIRYTDAILSGAAYISLLGFFYQVLVGVGFRIMPFAFMMISIGVYFLAQSKLNEVKFHFWRKNLQFICLLSLLSFYLAGNYFVVREAGEVIMHNYLSKGEDIPLAIVFYLFTAIIPLIYIYWGLKTKNKLLLLTGLGITAIAALTFKNYFSLGHPEILFTAVGIVLIVLAWGCILFFKAPRYGITFLPDKNYKELEALALLQSFGKVDTAAPKQDFEFGGGQFGGGGAGSDF